MRNLNSLLDSSIKYILLLTISISLLLPMSSCQETPEDTAEFYVKYEAAVQSRYITNSIKYTVNTENGSQTFVTGKEFSETFGPFKRGFFATIAVEASDLYDSPQCEVRIYVCKGAEPFALKASVVEKNNATVSYTIDY